MAQTCYQMLISEHCCFQLRRKNQVKQRLQVLLRRNLRNPASETTQKVLVYMTFPIQDTYYWCSKEPLMTLRIIKFHYFVDSVEVEVTKGVKFKFTY